MEYEYFNQAADILDVLTLEGFFGGDAKELVKTREQKSSSLHLYDCLMNIFISDNDYGITNSIGITFRLIDFYTDAMKIKPQETVDLLASFMKGTKTNPELENLSSYTEWMQCHVAWKDTIPKIQPRLNVSKSDIMRSTSALLTTYSKGVELIGKIFTVLIAIAKIIKHEEYNLIDISCLTIYDKIKLFEKITDDKHHILTTTIDRKIRNADSHLNAIYSIDKKAFIMKRNIRQGKINKIEMFEVKLSDMMLIIYPKIGWMVQGFISSCILLVLSKEDNELYKNATKVLISKCSN